MFAERIDRMTLQACTCCFCPALICVIPLLSKTGEPTRVRVRAQEGGPLEAVQARGMGEADGRGV